MKFFKYWDKDEGDVRATPDDYTLGEVAADYAYNFDLTLQHAIDAVSQLEVGQRWSDGSTAWRRVS